jgi:hypothetical protein
MNKIDQIGATVVFYRLQSGDIFLDKSLLLHLALQPWVSLGLLDNQSLLLSAL